MYMVQGALIHRSIVYLKCLWPEISPINYLSELFMTPATSLINSFLNLFEAWARARPAPKPGPRPSMEVGV